MGVVSKEVAKDYCISLYEYCTARSGKRQVIKDISIIDSFLAGLMSDRIQVRFLVDYLAWHMSKWLSLGYKLMPNMIFGKTAYKKYSESDYEIDWVGLRKYGILKYNMLEIVGVDINATFDSGDYLRKITLMSNPMRCLIIGSVGGEYCNNCKSRNICLVIKDIN